MSGDDRYSRQERFAGIGPDGQARLASASAVLVGCGALGSVQAELLVRAGIGRLRILDRDFVEPSNLQRQMLFTEEDAASALPKAVAAARRLARVNSAVPVEPVVADLTPAIAEAQLAGFDLLLDGTDSFETRFLINDVAVKTGRPWIYGACVGSYGICMPVLPGVTACLRCLLGGVPPAGSTATCDTAGVIGPIVSLVASLQAAEALKLLTGQIDRVRRGLISIDLWQGTEQALRVRRDPDCAACGRGSFEHLEGAPRTAPARLCGRDGVQIVPAPGPRPDLPALARRLEPLGPVVANEYLVRVDLGAQRLTVFRDGRAIVQGTEDLALARSIYARTLGS